MVSLAKGTPKRFDEELVMMQKEDICNLYVDLHIYIRHIGSMKEWPLAESDSKHPRFQLDRSFNPLDY